MKNFLLILLFLFLISSVSGNPLEISKMPPEEAFSEGTSKHFPVFSWFYGEWNADTSIYLNLFNQLKSKWGEKIIFIKIDIEKFSGLKEQKEIENYLLNILK
ncbi:MAG: hypothetical protein HYU63_06850 [Armatimonadetes bacterium]|nr:hypothetical protein [Armatimonadota bacterium]